jgi:hypothetical protein
MGYVAADVFEDIPRTELTCTRASSIAGSPCVGSVSFALSGRSSWQRLSRDGRLVATRLLQLVSILTAARHVITTIPTCEGNGVRTRRSRPAIAKKMDARQRAEANKEIRRKPEGMDPAEGA